MTYCDIDPMDIDPDTGRPYSNYSSASLDTSFHDHEMDVDDDPRATIFSVGEIVRWPNGTESEVRGIDAMDDTLLRFDGAWIAAGDVDKLS